MSKKLDEIYERFISELKERYIPSKSAQILDIFDYLENARKEGAKVSDLCFFLKQLGIDVSEAYLPNLMYRIRKEKGLTRSNKKNKTEGRQEVPLANNNQQTAFVNGATSVVTKTASTTSKSKPEKEPYDHIKNLPVNEKYAHVYRFRKVNGSIDYFVGTPAEEYYSLGGDPDDGFEKLHSRYQRSAVTKLYNKVNRQKYIYHDYIE